MKIIHISDLHFGTHIPDIYHSLLDIIQSKEPDLVLISGDFTQRASKEEFEVSQSFMGALKSPVFCIPGNHDIPPYPLYERFFHPYRRYKRYIAHDLCPEWDNEDIALIGLNSARRMLPHWNWANGMVSSAQREKANRFFEAQSQEKWRVCTFHHPVHKIDDMPLNVTVFGHRKTKEMLHKNKVDLVLTGHVHHASINILGDQEHKTVYLSASTAVSSRLRAQENGFNEITFSGEKMKINIYIWEKTKFVPHTRFEHAKM